MTDTTIYTRQNNIPLNIPSSIAIVGCGGVGSWLSIYSAMVGVKNIYLYDSDRIEEHNLNRLPLPKESVGKRKTAALTEMINRMREECIVHDGEHLTEDDFNVLGICDYVIDCTDDYPFQLKLSKYCRENRIKYIKAGYDGPHITITSTIPEWDVEPADTNHYNTPPVPSFVVPASIAASLTLTSILFRVPFELSFNIHELKM